MLSAAFSDGMIIHYDEKCQPHIRALWTSIRCIHVAIHYKILYFSCFGRCTIWLKQPIIMPILVDSPIAKVNFKCICFFRIG